MIGWRKHDREGDGCVYRLFSLGRIMTELFSSFDKTLFLHQKVWFPPNMALAKTSIPYEVFNFCSDTYLQSVELG
jgi:hypothetical protein